MNGKPVVNVPAKSIINFDSGFSKKLLCDGPTFSAGTACAYSCAFCYVPAIMRKSPHLKGQTLPHEQLVIRRSGAAGAMRNQLIGKGGKPKFNDPNDKRVIYASPLVDVAANMDLVRETIEMCKIILSLTHWHIRLLSKSNLLPEVAKGLDGFCGSDEARERIIYGVSTGTLDDKLALAFERGCPLVSKRITSLHWLQDEGYRTFAMVCPSLPIPKTHPAQYYDFALACSDALRYGKCEHVWAEVINVRGESFTRTHHELECAGFTAYADALHVVSEDKQAWEEYARETFLAHASVVPDGKLRFLQYVNKDNAVFWTSHKHRGAVLL